jgi:hypothetical protein
MKRVILPLLSLFVIFLCARVGSAETRQYTLAVSTGTPYDMSTGTTTIWLGGTGGGSRFFAFSGAKAIGFTFKLDAISYTDFQIYTSGLITLGTDTLLTYTQNNLAGYNKPLIAPFWDSLSMTGSQAGCVAPKVHYKVFGSAPNRVLVVEWKDLETVYTKGARGTVQARLYEDGKIEFYYASMNNCATCGPQNGTCGNSLASIGFANSTTNFLSVTPNGSTATKSVLAANNSVNIAAGNNPISANTLYTFVRMPAAQLQVKPPYTLAFDTTSPGGYRELCVWVKNVGTEGPLTFSAATFGGVAPDGYSVPNLPPNLNPGDSALYCIRFTPPSTGLYPAVVTIQSNGLDSATKNIAVSGYSANTSIQIIPVGVNTTTRLFRNARVKVGDSLEQKFAVKNIGGGILSLSNATFIDGDYFHYYKITRLPNRQLAYGEIDTVKVKFFARREGSSLAELHLVSNAFNGTQNMDLTGVGIIPRIEFVQGPNMFFDSVVMGDSLCQTMTIRNAGSDTLILKLQYFTTNDGDYTYYGLTGNDTKILAGTSKDVSVCFKPLQKGDRIAGIRYTTNIPQTFEPYDGLDDGYNGINPETYLRRDTSAAEFGISGIGTPIGRLSSQALLSKSIEDSTLIGTTICHSIDIRNAGDEDIRITDIDIIGIAAGDYTFTGLVEGQVLKPNTQVIAQLCGTPSARGTRPANLSILGISEGRISSLSAALDIKGLHACASSTMSTLHDSNMVCLKMTGNDTIGIANCGDIAANYATQFVGDQSYSVARIGAGNVAPNDTAWYVVTFAPQTKGIKNSTLKFTAPNVPVVTIALSGIGVIASPDAAENVTAPGTPERDTNEFEVTIANTGNADWVMGNPFITPDSLFTFIKSKSDSVIPAGGTGKITLSFHPHSIATHSGLITFPGGGPCQDTLLTINLFGTGVVNAVREVASSEGFILEQNAPNPASGRTTITYSIPRDANVRIIMTDITGKMIKELTSGRVSSGKHELSVSTANIASGSYLYILESGNVRLVRQMIINK